ncbi:MAG TPA: YicC/YloC family endoribonuclease [Candidatus Polarisedimenticolaceae bacterium]|nr:YicC/YloC family endoribonuclease [Candidatus Polarisedimenticolaceae bacterium]
MTGFGQGAAESGGLRVSVELRGVNNRFNDLRFRMPAELAHLEPELRRRAMRRVRRGRVEIGIRVEPPGGSQPRPILNQPLLDEVTAVSKRLETELGLTGPLRPGEVLSIPGMFKQESLELGWSGSNDQLVFDAFDGALARFDADCLREGEALRADIVARVASMAGHSAAARRLAPTVPETLRAKLLHRLDSLRGAIELDAARVAQEAAFLADRADVTEELVRFDGHLTQTRALLDEPDGEPLGKRIEFLFQEMHREANTVCSKSADLELTRHALAIKLEIEKAREQAQNLE